MSVNTYQVSIVDAPDLFRKVFCEEFELDEKLADNLYKTKIEKHLNKLKDNLYLICETDYVDRVYRDSYYHYYSSKLGKYKRNCFRVSLFAEKIDMKDFRDPSKVEKLQNGYRGFFVIRPTEPFLMGRSVVAPEALKMANFSCCITNFNTTVNSIKVNVQGFPHSSQDTETITCAETTLWAIMEYYSNRYPDYKPTLPSKIIETLSRSSFERQIPSKGLNITQMSYALKDFGFGTRIYAKEKYGKDFDKLISCYIESGIPMIVAIENRHKGGSIGHALICVGHETVTADMINSLKPHGFESKELKLAASRKKLKCYDFDAIEKKFLFVDDNMPVYQMAHLAEPAMHYEADWQNCEITYLIVPLYPKIYLEAFEAKNFIARFLINGPSALADDQEVLLRTYLASSRSFKDKLAMNTSFSADVRDLILETSMPKFIWVAEISNKALAIDKKAHGLVILDATEANTFKIKPLVIAAFDSKVITFKPGSEKLEIKNIPLDNFSIFENNLKHF